jgi:hypothetical protein
VVAIALLAVIVAGGIVAVERARSYAPLAFFQGGYGPDTPSPLYYTSISAPFGDGQSAVVLHYRPNKVFRYGFDVHNGGGSTIRFEGIETQPGWWKGPIGVVGAEVQPDEQRKTFDGLRPIRGAVIQPDQYLFVVPVFRTSSKCNSEPGGVSVMRSVRLRYSYRRLLHRFYRTQTIEMPSLIGIVCGNPRQVVSSMFGPEGRAWLASSF